MSSWNYSMGSRIGPYHVTMGTPNQDSIGIETNENLTMLVVADGAGSLARSDVGSNLAIETCRKLFKNIDEVSVESVEAIVEKARSTLVELDDDEIGCTLSLVVFNDAGDWAACAIGDSFCLIHDEDNNFSFVSQPDGVYANITELLTSSNPQKHSAEGTGAIGVAVASDGMTHSSITKREPVESLWKNLFSKTEKNARGLDVEGFFNHMESKELIDDDTSLAIAAKRGAF